MAEYINKKEALYQICAEKCGNYGYEECAAQKRCIECQIIEDFPAADVAPVVHGRWEAGYYNELGIYVRPCSNCWWENEELSPYCPNCGARMDGTEVTDEVQE